MTQARGPILSPGFYWLDAFDAPEGKPKFSDWIERSTGIVKVLSTSRHADEPRPRDWVLFQVRFPAPWTAADAAAFGFPTVAPRGAQTTESDTRSAPAASADPGWGLLANLFTGDGSITGVVVLGGLLYLLTSGSRR